MSEERKTEDIAGRLTRAEQALAHMEHQLDELNGVITEQWKEIDRLRRDNERLVDRIEQVEAGPGPGAPTHEKPPHY